MIRSPFKYGFEQPKLRNGAIVIAVAVGLLFVVLLLCGVVLPHTITAMEAVK